MISGDPYLAALKLFLVFGPLLGFAAVELATVWRGKRRAAEARPPIPARRAAAVRSRGGLGVEG